MRMCFPCSDKHKKGTEKNGSFFYALFLSDRALEAAGITGKRIIEQKVDRSNHRKECKDLFGGAIASHNNHAFYGQILYADSPDKRSIFDDGDALGNQRRDDIMECLGQNDIAKNL